MYNFTNFLITLKNVPAPKAVLVRSMCVYVVIHSFRYIILNIEINIATTSDLVPFGCKLPSNRHRNLLFAMSLSLPRELNRLSFFSPSATLKYLFAFIGWIIAFDWLDFIAISVSRIDITS